MAIKKSVTTSTNTTAYRDGIERGRDDFHPYTVPVYRQSTGRTAFAAYNNKLLHQDDEFGKMPEFLPVKKKTVTPVGTRKEKVATTTEQPLMQYDRYTFRQKMHEKK